MITWTTAYLRLPGMRQPYSRRARGRGTTIWTQWTIVVAFQTTCHPSAIVVTVTKLVRCGTCPESGESAPGGAIPGRPPSLNPWITDPGCLRALGVSKWAWRQERGAAFRARTVMALTHRSPTQATAKRSPTPAPAIAPTTPRAPGSARRHLRKGLRPTRRQRTRPPRSRASATG
jgi:hypothetical protein